MSDELLADCLPENGPSIDDLQHQIKMSGIPSHGDGISNAFRTYFICEVFDVQDIDLNQVFPFGAMLACKDKEKVRASIHLAKLQFQFNEACLFNEYVEPDMSEYHACYLHHMIRQLAHHLSYLERDKPTPPLGFH